MRVLCVGDLMVDVLALLPSDLRLGSDIPAPVSVSGGGSAANTAAWLAAAGAATTFAGRVGADAFGRLALDELAAGGVDLAVTVDPDRPTGICIVLVDSGGERTMVPSPGANAALTVDTGLVVADTHLHVSAYALFLDGARPALDAAVAQAAAVGAPVSVDAASAAPLEAFGVAGFLAWLPRCLLFANRDEAALLAGTDEPAGAARALGARCGEAIVKLGAEGALWSDGTRTVHESAPRVPVVDSTGAGDAFAAGVLAARIRGAGVGQCLRAGSAQAARAVGRTGARPPGHPDP
jgi:sugar/nucleoside kinase (ribokinase family)